MRRPLNAIKSLPDFRLNHLPQRGALLFCADFKAFLAFEWSCVLGSDGTCVSTASCDYFGNITICELLGGFDATGWSGTMSAGIDGSLPDTNGDGTNSPIVEDFDCSF
jgi:hypothetical protein